MLMKDNQRSNKSVIWCVRISVWVSLLVFLLVISIPGGFLNRIRGGYQPVPNGDGFITHNGLRRLAFSGPTGFMCLVFILIRASLILPDNPHDLANVKNVFVKFVKFLILVISMLFFIVVTYFGLYVGWGVYFGIGRNPHGYRSRPGCFDWLVGHDPKGATFPHRWFVEFSGMSLRGLVWTTSPGLVLMFLGFGSEFVFSGVTMGLAYEIGHDLPLKIPNFSQGTPIAEFIWGIYLWMVMIVCVFGNANPPRKKPSVSVAEWKSRVAKFMCWFFFEWPLEWMLIWVIFGVFMVSVWQYAYVRQSDMRNKNQTWLGLAIVTLFIPFAVACILLKMCLENYLRKRRRIKANEEKNVPQNLPENLTEIVEKQRVDGVGENSPLLLKLEINLNNVEFEAGKYTSCRNWIERFIWQSNIFWFLKIVLRYWNYLMCLVVFFTTIISVILRLVL